MKSSSGVESLFCPGHVAREEREVTVREVSGCHFLNSALETLKVPVQYSDIRLGVTIGP